MDDFDEFKEKVDSQFEFNATKINAAVGKITHINETFEELESKINGVDKVFQKRITFLTDEVDVNKYTIDRLKGL